MADGATGDDRTSQAPRTHQSLRRRVMKWGSVGAVFALMIAAIVGGVVGLHLRAAASKPDHEPTPLPVETTAVVMQSSYDVAERFTGRLETARSTHLSFELGGLVTEVEVDEGDAVSAGQIVARLDTVRLQAGRDSLAAGKREAEAQLSLAKLTARRQAALARDGHSSRQRYDEARFNVTALEAQVSRLQAEIDRVDIDIAKSTLKAPFAGNVAARLIDEGAVVEPGTTILDLIETGRVNARIGLPPHVANDLNLGTQYSLVINGAPTMATLTSLRRDLQTDTRTVAAIFEMDEGSDAAMGEVIHLERLTSIDAKGAWLPLAALQEGDKGLWTIFTVVDTPDGPQVRSEAVEIIHASGDRVFARGTLVDGARVITSGRNRVVAGQHVAVLNE